MRFILTGCFLVLLTSGVSRAAQDGHHGLDAVKPVCAVTASGGDDAPHFLHAVKSCRKVVIPKKTTLNIASRLNMTGVVDKHIVNLFPLSWNQLFKIFFRICKEPLGSHQTFLTGLE